MVEEVLAAALAPRIYYHLLVTQHPEPWLILVPEALKSLCVCDDKEQDTGSDLTTEQILLKQEPSTGLWPVHLIQVAFMYRHDVPKRPHRQQYRKKVWNANDQHQVFRHNKLLPSFQHEAEHQENSTQQVGPSDDLEHEQLVRLFIFVV